MVKAMLSRERSLCYLWKFFKCPILIQMHVTDHSRAFAVKN